jgi:hypothetical protein
MPTNSFFRDFIGALRPGFLQYLPKSDHTYSGKWLDKVHEHVVSRVGQVLKCAHYRTLSGDGWKNCIGKHVINFTDVIRGKWAVFKTSVPQTESNNPEYHARVMEEAMRSPDNLGKQTLTDNQVKSRYAAVVCDNVKYMRDALVLLKNKFPWLITLGCAAHVLDLLCEDIAKIKEIETYVTTVVSITVFVRNCLGVYLAARKPTGVKVGMRNYPDTRFVYAGLMLSRLCANRFVLHAMLTTTRFWDAIKNHKRSGTFGNFVSRPEFFTACDYLQKLYAPISVAVDALGADSANITMICVLWVALESHVMAWCEDPKNPLKEETKLAVCQCFRDRWGGTTWGTGSTRLVGLFNEAHLAAWYFNPYLKLQTIPAGHVAILRRVILSFFDNCEDSVEFIDTWRQFSEYLGESNKWESPINDARAEVETVLKLAEASVPPPAADPVSTALRKISACGNAYHWWKLYGENGSMLQEIAMRLTCASPTSTSTERINSMNKLVQSDRRGSMHHEKVCKALYCYANLRFLNRVAENTDVGMLHSLVRSLDSKPTDITVALDESLAHIPNNLDSLDL